MKKFYFDSCTGEHLLFPIWERTWWEPDRNLNFTRELLAEERACSGFGVRSPFAILVSPKTVQTKTLARGRTLAQELIEKDLPKGEPIARSCAEQLCYGLHRLHEGLGTPFGAMYPYNIGRHKHQFFLWSAPTASLESDYTPPTELDRNWDLPYEPPEEEHSIEADIYGLGRIMLELLTARDEIRFKTLSNESYDVSRRAQPKDILDTILVTQQRKARYRFRDVVSLAQALNPDTKLSDLDVLGGLSMMKTGLEAVRRENWEQAEEAWSDGLKADWLSVALWNNLAVCKMRRELWSDALDELQKAHRLDVSHQPVYCSFGYCLLQMGEKEEAVKWILQALEMKPHSVSGNLLLSKFAIEKGTLKCANRQIKNHDFLSLLLINEMEQPPWGAVVTEEPPPDPDDESDEGSARVPRRPVPPTRSASAKRPLG